MRIADIGGDSLVDRIKSAFANTEYPGDDAIPSRPDSVGEAPDQFRQLRGREWADLEVEEIAGLSPVLLWLSPEGLSYYQGPKRRSWPVACFAGAGLRLKC
jgi:hypothetical protein